MLVQRREPNSEPVRAARAVSAASELRREVVMLGGSKRHFKPLLEAPGLFITRRQSERTPLLAGKFPFCRVPGHTSIADSEGHPAKSEKAF